MKKNEFRDSIKNKVYEFRLLKQSTQNELAEAVWVSKQIIFVMGKNNYSPLLVLSYRITNFFQIDIEDIFTYVGKDDNND